MNLHPEPATQQPEAQQSPKPQPVKALHEGHQAAEQQPALLHSHGNGPQDFQHEHMAQEPAKQQQQEPVQRREREGTEAGQAGHAGHPDLASTDLLGSRALGPLGLALRDSGELPAQPATGLQPELVQAAPQNSTWEAANGQEPDSAVQTKKKRSGFGSFFKRKSPQAK